MQLLANHTLRLARLWFSVLCELKKSIKNGTRVKATKQSICAWEMTPFMTALLTLTTGGARIRGEGGNWDHVSIKDSWREAQHERSSSGKWVGRKGDENDRSITFQRHSGFKGVDLIDA
jgi:hypothetical protein